MHPPRFEDRAPRGPVPGALYPWLRRASWIELGLFAALVCFWLAPGYEGATTVFGWAHGIGYLALLFAIWIGVLRGEVSFWLLIATLTPVGPLGSVIGIAIIDRRTTPRVGRKRHAYGARFAPPDGPDSGAS